MDSETRDKLIALHQLLYPHNGQADFSSFRDCFKVFRGYSSSVQSSQPGMDIVSTTNRLKRLLPHNTVAQVLSSEDQAKKMDHLIEELQHSPGVLAKVPEFLEFIRTVATNQQTAIGDGLWNSVGHSRTHRTATPESGFATTPQEGPPFGSSLFPGSALHATTPSGPPVPSSVLLRPPPALPVISGYSVVTESQMVRDLLCVVLGFDGVLVKLTTDGCRVTNANLQIDNEMRQMALKIAYTGWLSLRLKKFCEMKQTDFHLGLCSQRMASVVMEELQQYRKNIALLDAKMHRDDPDHAFIGPTNRSDQLSLRKFHHAILDDQHRLHTLLNLVNSTNGLKGGELVSALYKFSHHGDPLIQLVASKLTYVAVEPILTKIRRWVFSGLLDDPFNEFFVGEDLDAAPDAYWSDHYQLRDAMIPYFLAADVAKGLFAGGKSIAFIKTQKDSAGRRHDRSGVASRIVGMEPFTNLSNCSFDGPDPIWDMQRNRIKPESLEQLLQASDVAARSVVNMLRDDYNLGSHIYALQKFFLLGQGDFILCLIDGLVEYLNEPAVNLHLKNLSGILEFAINSTEAKWEHPDVIQALDTLVKAVDDKEIGWDAFLLEYRLKKKNFVLSIVLTNSVLNRYKRIFAFLWRMKRAEFLLCSIWQEFMCTRMENCSIPGFELLSHEAWLLLHRMLEFVQQLQYAFSVEILEIGWSTFLVKLTNARSLDDILSFHNDYLSLVEEKCFIQSKTLRNCQDLGIHLRTVLNQIIKFDACFAHMQDAAQRELTNLADGEPDMEGDFYMRKLPSLFTRIQTMEAQFKSEVCRFTSILEKSDNDEPPSNLRSGLDYNRHYVQTGKKVRNLETLTAAGFDNSPLSF